MRPYQVTIFNLLMMALATNGHSFPNSIAGPTALSVPTVLYLHMQWRFSDKGRRENI